MGRLATTLSALALGICLGFVPMADGPVLTVAILLASVGIAILTAMAIDELSWRRWAHRKGLA